MIDWQRRTHFSRQCSIFHLRPMNFIGGENRGKQQACCHCPNKLKQFICYITFHRSACNELVFYLIVQNKRLLVCSSERVAHREKDMKGDGRSRMNGRKDDSFHTHNLLFDDTIAIMPILMYDLPTYQ